jgi:hypothetical protein
LTILLGFSGGVGGGGGALAGVVVYIPTGAFEAEGGSGDWALQDSMTLGTFCLRGGGEFLDLFKEVAALGAAIGIQRQGFHTLH